MLWNGTELKSYDDLYNLAVEDYERGKESEKYALSNIYSSLLANIQNGKQVEDSKAFLASMLAREHVYLHQDDPYVSKQNIREISNDLLEHAYKYPDLAEYAADCLLDTQNQDPNREYFREFGQRRVVLPRHLHQKIVDRIASFPDSSRLFIDFGAYTSNTKAPWTAEDLLRLPKTKDGDAANYLSNLITEGSPELRNQYIDHVLAHKGELGHAPFQALLSSMSWTGAIPNDKHAKILDAYMDLHPEGVLDALTSYSKNPLRNLTDEEVRNLYQKAQKHVDSKVATEIELASKDSNVSPKSIEMIDGAIRNMYKYKLSRFEDEFENRKPEKRVANFWYEYERSVEPEHFALAKSLHTNQPETVTDHRGNTGSSDLHYPLLDAFRDYAKRTQEEVLKYIGQEDKDGHPITGSLPGIKVNGQWHVKVYRGVAGDYADTILKAIQHPDSTPDNLKIVEQKISIPSAHLSSWTTDPAIAQRFASRNIEGQQRDHGIVFGAHLPVSQILHSGFMDVFPNQAHAHRHEAELIFHHAGENPVHRVDTEEIQVLEPMTGQFKNVQYVQPEQPKSDMDKSEKKSLKKEEMSDQEWEALQEKLKELRERAARSVRPVVTVTLADGSTKDIQSLSDDDIKGLSETEAYKLPERTYDWYMKYKDSQRIENAPIGTPWEEWYPKAEEEARKRSASKTEQKQRLTQILENRFDVLLRHAQPDWHMAQTDTHKNSMLKQQEIALQDLATMVAKNQHPAKHTNKYAYDKVIHQLRSNAYKYPELSRAIADSIVDLHNRNPIPPSEKGSHWSRANPAGFDRIVADSADAKLTPEDHQRVVEAIAKEPFMSRYATNYRAPWQMQDLFASKNPEFIKNALHMLPDDHREAYVKKVMNDSGIEPEHYPIVIEHLQHGMRRKEFQDLFVKFFHEHPREALLHLFNNPETEIKHSIIDNLSQYIESNQHNIDSWKLNKIIDRIDEAKFIMPDEQGDLSPLNDVADFWYDFEKDVKPEHFALAKSLVTGQGEQIQDHRGKTGDSYGYEHLLNHFKEYAKITQRKIIDRIKNKQEEGFEKDGKWYIKVYRGVAGNYADHLAKQIEHHQLSSPNSRVFYDMDADIPMAHMASWSTNPKVAETFAGRQIGGHQKDFGFVISSHLPVSDILHCGFVDLYQGHTHAHPVEQELVFKHHGEPPYLTVKTKDMELKTAPHAGFVPYSYVDVNGDTANESETPEPDSQMDMNKTEYPMPKPEMENNVAFVQKHGKHLFEQLPLNKRMGLMALMEACDIPKNHPHYYGIIVNKPFDYIKSQPFREHLNQKMGLDDFDAKRMYTQMQEATSMIKQYAEDTVHDPVNDTFHQSSSLKTKFKKHDEHDTFLRRISEKAKDTIISWGHKHGAEYEEDKDVVGDMVGAQAKFDALIEAAKFVAGRKDIPLDRMRHSFVLFEDDIEAAALHAAGLKDTEANRTAIREVAKMADFVKFDASLERPKAILPTDKSSKNTAEEINSAFDSGDVQSVKLTGKHSKGTLIARDPKTHHVWLIKPGSGATSPAAGVAEEFASQSAREAAFSHVARLFHLGNVVVKAEMLKVDGQEWAALAMLPYNYQNADKWKTQDYAFLVRTLDSYRAEGTLHKLAVLDFVLGNPDRHAQNVMVSKEGQITMIDHGSAFAGSMFSPDKDTKSFVPFYLRYNTREFNKMDRERKLAIMPKMPRLMHKKFVEWIGKLDANKMAEEIQHFGINPAASLKRLEIIKALPHAPAGDATIDEMINALWLDT